MKILPKNINRYLSKNICIPLKKETKRILLLFESSKDNNKEKVVIIFQIIDNSNTENNIFDNVKEVNTFKNNHNMKITVIDENAGIREKTILCCEITESVFDNIGNLAIKIAGEFPGITKFLEDQKEMKRLLSQFYTISKLSGNEAIHSNKFLEYYNTLN